MWLVETGETEDDFKKVCERRHNHTGTHPYGVALFTYAGSKRRYFKRKLCTFVHPREAVFEHGQFIDLAKLLEDWPQVLLLQVARYLTHEELDGILVFHGHCRSLAGLTLWVVVGGVLLGRMGVRRGEAERMAMVMRLKSQVVVVQYSVL